MGWERKKGGPASGYYYMSRRVPGKRYPVKVYYGRKAAGSAAAAAVHGRKLLRREQKDLVRKELESTADADRLAAELHDWAESLAAIWLVATGYHQHRGCWRKKRG